MTHASPRSFIALTAILFCTAVLAQTGARDVRHVKVVSVDEDTVVVWDQFGAQQYTVPDGFRFTVDGKELPVAELEAGMEGTADVSKATSVKPVHVTEINMGKVVSQVGRTVTVRDGNGQVHRFTQSDADERGVRLYMGSDPVRISQLEPGDELSVTVVSEQPPEILTAGDVAASIEGTDAAAAAATKPVAPAAGTTEATVDETATADDAFAIDKDRVWLWILAVIVIAAILGLLLRRRPSPRVVKTRIEK